MVTKRNLTALFVLAAVLTASSASGQIVYGQPASGNTGFTFTSWKIERDSTESKLTQFWTPVSGFVPLADNLEGRFWIATANNKLEVGNAEASMFGLGDLRMQVSQSLAEDFIVAAVGVNLPTGKKSLTIDTTGVDERQIMEALSQSYLDVPMRRYGEGFGFSAMLGAANSYGDLSIGGGARYEFIGKYDPYENLKEYDPGDMFSLYAGGDLKKDNSFWSLNFTFVTFLADKLSGNKAFKQGDQFDVQLTGRMGPSNRNLRVVVDYLIRGRNTVYEVASGDLIEQLKLYGNEFLVAADYVFMWPSKWYVSPSASFKLIAANEAPIPLGDSNLLGFGGAVGRQLSEQVTLELGLRYYTGSADDGNLDLTGFQLQGGLAASF
jgi:hypothetical protein